MTDDPYAHMPLMSRPDFVYRPSHHVRARRVKVGDIVLEREHGKPDERWTVTGVEERFGIVYVTYKGRDRKTALGLSTERVWIAREEPYPPKKEDK